RGDEARVEVRAVEVVGPPDRPEVGVVPVDVAGVDGQALGSADAGDVVLVDPGAVKVGPADRPGHVGPVDVRGVDRHPLGVAGAGDEALVHVRAVDGGAPDRTVRVVVPVDVRRAG